MPMTKRDLAPAEIDAFLKDNQWESLTFTGGDPYAIPMGYMYKRGDVLLGLTSTGRKMNYLKKSHKICFLVCKPRWQTPDLKESCTSLIIEGELKEVTDRVYYGLSPEPTNPGGALYRLEISRTGTRKCTTVPCEILAAREKK